MITIKNLFAVSIILLGMSSAVQAQRFQAGADFSTAVPLGTFKDNVINNGYGVSGNFLIRIGSLPLLAGIDLGTVRYGSTSRREPLGPTIPEVTVKVQTNNNIFLNHFLLRLQPREGRVRPYADGLIGLKYLSTSTSVSDTRGGEAIASTKNFSDTAFSYGYGGGLQVRLARTARSEILFDSKIHYLRGGRAEYLREGSIRQVDGGLVFDVFSSRTDIIGLQFGVTFHF